MAVTNFGLGAQAPSWAGPNPNMMSDQELQTALQSYQQGLAQQAAQNTALAASVGGANGPDPRSAIAQDPNGWLAASNMDLGVRDLMASPQLSQFMQQRQQNQSALQAAYDKSQVGSYTGGNINAGYSAPTVTMPQNPWVPSPAYGGPMGQANSNPSGQVGWGGPFGAKNPFAVS